jgi:hypothetical protein
MNLELYIDRKDIVKIFKNVINELPSTKYNIGQKIISELISKLTEQIFAEHFTKKLKSHNIKVTSAISDRDTDITFHIGTEQIPLEIKVSMISLNGKSVIWRGGEYSKRNSDTIFISRNSDVTEFFAVMSYVKKSEWEAPFKSANNTSSNYYAPTLKSESIYKMKHKVLCGNFIIDSSSRRNGKINISLEKI